MPNFPLARCTDYRTPLEWARSHAMAPEVPIHAGAVLAGKYRLERLLGSGGMGVVYSATHLGLDRPVAIKLLRPENWQNEPATARFLMEARATASLRGPHVAKILDVDRLEGTLPYLVMEYLEGTNLQSLLDERGPFSVAQAVDALLETCEALAEAHRVGIVHRDLKPANLFLARDPYGEPCIKVLDFGISKFLEPSQPFAVGLTDSRTLIGSPIYMSPEQMRSARDVDHRTDIWSAGAVLFELLAGRPVWAGTSLSEVCAQVTRDPPPSLLELCPDIAPELFSIIERCLQKNPALRYQRIVDLALALRRYASPRGELACSRVVQLSGHDVDASATTLNAQQMRPAALEGIETTLQGTAATQGSQKRRLSLLPVAATLACSLVIAAAFRPWLRAPDLLPATVPEVPSTSTSSSASPPKASVPDAGVAIDSGTAPPVLTSAAHRDAPRSSPDRDAKARPASRSAASHLPGSTTVPVDPMSIRK